MVHLAQVPTDSATVAPISGHLEKLKVKHLEHPDKGHFSSSVYGSKYAVLDLPKHEMPEGEMPKEVAYRMIKYVLGHLFVLGPCNNVLSISCGLSRLC
jgi:glutamate decarboxylase